MINYYVLQSIQPASAAGLYTENLGTQTRSIEAELESIIESRIGSKRALPELVSSPTLMVRLAAVGLACSTHVAEIPAVRASVGHTVC